MRSRPLRRFQHISAHHSMSGEKPKQNMSERAFLRLRCFSHVCNKQAPCRLSQEFEGEIAMTPKPTMSPFPDDFDDFMKTENVGQTLHSTMI